MTPSGTVGAIKAHRVLISDILNVHLEYAGQQARVHPDTLEQRQLHRTPEPKLLPSESRAYREQGQISARMQEVLDIRQERASQGAKEQEQARTYWERRKVELGITACAAHGTQALCNHRGTGTRSAIMRLYGQWWTLTSDGKHR